MGMTESERYILWRKLQRNWTQRIRKAKRIMWRGFYYRNKRTMSAQNKFINSGSKKWKMDFEINESAAVSGGRIQSSFGML